MQDQSGDVSGQGEPSPPSSHATVKALETSEDSKDCSSSPPQQQQQPTGSRERPSFMIDLPCPAIRLEGGFVAPSSPEDIGLALPVDNTQGNSSRSGINRKSGRRHSGGSGGGGTTDSLESQGKGFSTDDVSTRLSSAMAAGATARGTHYPHSSSTSALMDMAAEEHSTSSFAGLGGDKVRRLVGAPGRDVQQRLLQPMLPRENSRSSGNEDEFENSELSAASPTTEMDRRRPVGNIFGGAEPQEEKETVAEAAHRRARREATRSTEIARHGVRAGGSEGDLFHHHEARTARRYSSAQPTSTSSTTSSSSAHWHQQSAHAYLRNPTHGGKCTPYIVGGGNGGGAGSGGNTKHSLHSHHLHHKYESGASGGSNSGGDGEAHSGTTTADEFPSRSVSSQSKVSHTAPSSGTHKNELTGIAFPKYASSPPEPGKASPNQIERNVKLEVAVNWEGNTTTTTTVTTGANAQQTSFAPFAQAATEESAANVSQQQQQQQQPKKGSGGPLASALGNHTCNATIAATPVESPTSVSEGSRGGGGAAPSTNRSATPRGGAPPKGGNAAFLGVTVDSVQMSTSDDEFVSFALSPQPSASLQGSPVAIQPVETVQQSGKDDSKAQASPPLSLRLSQSKDVPQPSKHQLFGQGNHTRSENDVTSSLSSTFHACKPPRQTLMHGINIEKDSSGAKGDLLVSPTTSTEKTAPIAVDISVSSVAASPDRAAGGGTGTAASQPSQIAPRRIAAAAPSALHLRVDGGGKPFYRPVKFGVESSSSPTGGGNAASAHSSDADLFSTQNHTVPFMSLPGDLAATRRARGFSASSFMLNTSFTHNNQSFINDPLAASMVMKQSRTALISELERKRQKLRKQLAALQKEAIAYNVFALVRASNASQLQYLLQEKLCNVNERDYNGCTPLHVAASEGNQAVVRVLMSFGADVLAVDKGGRTPLDCAAANRHSGVARYLLAVIRGKHGGGGGGTSDGSARGRGEDGHGTADAAQEAAGVTGNQSNNNNFMTASGGHEEGKAQGAVHAPSSASVAATPINNTFPVGSGSEAGYSFGDQTPEYHINVVPSSLSRPCAGVGNNGHTAPHATAASSLSSALTAEVSPTISLNTEGEVPLLSAAHLSRLLVPPVEPSSSMQPRQQQQLAQHTSTSSLCGEETSQLGAKFPDLLATSHYGAYTHQKQHEPQPVVSAPPYLSGTGVSSGAVGAVGGGASGSFDNSSQTLKSTHEGGGAPTRTKHNYNDHGSLGGGDFFTEATTSAGSHLVKEEGKDSLLQCSMTKVYSENNEIVMGGSETSAMLRPLRNSPGRSGTAEVSATSAAGALANNNNNNNNSPAAHGNGSASHFDPSLLHASGAPTPKSFPDVGMQTLEDYRQETTVVLQRNFVGGPAGAQPLPPTVATKNAAAHGLVTTASSVSPPLLLPAKDRMAAAAAAASQETIARKKFYQTPSLAPPQQRINNTSGDLCPASTTTREGSPLPVLRAEEEEEEQKHVEAQHLQYSSFTTVSDTVSLIVCMVGLPGRGKSFISKRLVRYMNWKGVPCRVFNAGDYRRELLGVEGTANADFFDPDNPRGKELRERMAELACEDLVRFVSSHMLAVGILDATNTTRTRREWLKSFFSEQADKTGVKYRLLFIESVCTDDAIITENILRSKCDNDDFKNVKDTSAVIAEFRQRIRQYERVYETLEPDEGLPFIKIINVKHHVIVHNVHTGLGSRIAFFLQNLHPVAYPIYIALPGETVGDRSHIFGGDERLTVHGEAYAQALKRFIQDRYVPHMVVLHATNPSVLNSLKPLMEADEEDLHNGGGGVSGTAASGGSVIVSGGSPAAGASASGVASPVRSSPNVPGTKKILPSMHYTAVGASPTAQTTLIRRISPTESHPPAHTLDTSTPSPQRQRQQLPSAKELMSLAGGDISAIPHEETPEEKAAKGPFDDDDDDDRSSDEDEEEVVEEVLCPVPGLDDINYGRFGGQTALWVSEKYPRLSKLLYDSVGGTSAVSSPVFSSPSHQHYHHQQQQQQQQQGGCDCQLLTYTAKVKDALPWLLHIPTTADPRLAYCVQFPSGECSRQVNVRLEPALMAVMRTQSPVFVVAPSVPAQGMVAFFADVIPELSPTLRLPRDCVIEIGLKGMITVHTLLPNAWKPPSLAPLSSPTINTEEIAEALRQANAAVVSASAAASTAEHPLTEEEREEAQMMAATVAPKAESE